MLAFSKLGHIGRLGNQLFQYAFLRTQAERLGVSFYCPHWIGDDIFQLEDSGIRSEHADGILYSFQEPRADRQYDRSAIQIADNTEIMGYFESEKNFDTEKVKNWYVFKPDKVLSVKQKYASIDFSQSVGLHLRLGDKRSNKYFKNIYYVPRIQYYFRSLDSIGKFKNILVFSDDIPAAQEYFKCMDQSRIIYMKDNADWEDLYLMTQCRDFICGSSTLSWWGGWLGGIQDKGDIIFPQEGTFRPGSGFFNNAFIPEGGRSICALKPIRDHYGVIAFPFYNIHHRFILFIGRELERFFPRFFHFLLPYFR